MKAAVYVSKDTIEIQDLPIPKPGVGEILLKVSACGICGTDCHILAGEVPLAKPPVVLGHEICGTVAELGKGVSSLKVGDNICVDPVIGCGVCVSCKQGMTNLCDAPTIIGYKLPGGFEEYTLVPESHAYRIDSSVGIEGGVLSETLACVLHGYDRLNLKAGSSAMILGAGCVGLLWTELLRKSPITTLIQTDVIDFRVNLAEELGAELVLNPKKEDLKKAVLNALPGGVDYLIDATGEAAPIQEALPLVRKGGTVMLFGVCPSDQTLAIQPFEMFNRELTVLGSKMPPATLERASRLIESGLISQRKMVNKVLPLSKIKEGVKMFHNGKSEAIKIAIVPD